jgi:acetyl/propionyl-CoA carboxylase alpha subunit/acetyl-CoA carboxylase carboxyltransferase component
VLGIVNRGEAAMRCIRTVKRLRALERSDLSTLALYTPPDRDAPFVRHADRAVALPVKTTPVAAYLDRELVVETLVEAGADAVWPGWGFLAEDPLFVERSVEAGLVFLGPSAEAMRRLGDKISAKQLAERLGVPVTPWSGGAVEDAAAAEAAAVAIGYPVVIKASAGGGGRGIRMVETPEGLAEAFRSASAEALAAFGDGRVFLEKKLSGGRHVEVQIAADHHGWVRALGLRDCSVQRRHQKVVEEAPPPGLPAELDSALRRAAESVAREVGYVGVGTVEFLVDGRHFYFLEMNPRLQVEHGITEETTGLDLVELQIRIARGERLEGLSPPERGAAIEVRICAEDPDAGFLPSPGRIARFDPALGPGIRLDTGVTAGSVVPPDFDSLVAKLIASGADREQARTRLLSALEDFDLVVEGGATNKAFLIEILRSPDFVRGCVHTAWLDGLERPFPPPYALEGLIAAAILTYQANRRDALANFYADTSNLAPDRIPSSTGQEIDLTYQGEGYRLEVFAIGGWNYRVELEGRRVEANLREEGAHLARLILGGRTLRVLYDRTATGWRLEVESTVHRFGLQRAGQVRAATPAMVVAVHVEVGQAVEAGQSLGLLEAMKMEVAFSAPVSGVVAEVLVRPGQQVAAGDVLLVIEPSGADRAADSRPLRLRFAETPDPLAPLFREGLEGRLGEARFPAVEREPKGVRWRALRALRDEVRGILLGYDVDPERAERIAEFLEAPLPQRLSAAFRWRLAEIRHELAVAADIDELFRRTPSRSAAGELGPSNNERLRMYVRRIRAAGSGISEEFLARLRRALRHYGITSLAFSNALERAVVRLLASQRERVLRDRLILAILHRLQALSRVRTPLGRDPRLRAVLERIASLRGVVSDAVADAAVQTNYEIFQRPEIEARALAASQRVERELRWAETVPVALPEESLLELASAPSSLFARIRAWLDDRDLRRRALAAAAWRRRLYAPLSPSSAVSLDPTGSVELLVYPDGRRVLGVLPEPSGQCPGLREAVARAATEGPIHALEVLEATPDTVERILPEVPQAVERVTFCLDREGAQYRTFRQENGGFREDCSLQGLHPEVARRLGFARLVRFDLERQPAPEGIYCFFGKSRELPGDERLFVLADLPGFRHPRGLPVERLLPLFEQTFYEAARALRERIAVRDPDRRLLWNRITVVVSPTVAFDPSIAEPLARRLAPATRHLGLEKVVIRLEAALAGQDPRPIEAEVVDLTGTNLQLRFREPHDEPLRPASAYERKVVEARRRRVLYPYEIVRLLTESGVGPPDPAPGPSIFEEFDLDPHASKPTAVSVAGRPFGENRAAVVFGIVSTPTAKVPEGLRRVLILSDPTLGMGALAAPECDRIVAAIDLAERLELPVEWVPVSAGARIAMDSGTENLDATARVVRRIVTFTQRGGVIHVVVDGVNVGAQSYFDALATMLPHTRGALVMTPRGSMVLTGRAALEASGAVAAEDEIAIGGLERIMGPNGEAQYAASDFADAYRILYEHYRYTYVVPGEAVPRRFETADPAERDFTLEPCLGGGFETVGQIFDEATNPGRKKPFPMRPVMQALIDRDGGFLERWAPMVGAETAIVWDAHLGGWPVCLIGIESQNVPREGYRPLDGPSSWTGGTLFPLSSKKIARALNAASGNRPVVILANLSGFDGSPESMRKLQLEYGAEIARAIVNFDGAVFFVVVGRYHGGAYVVFSQELNEGLYAAALTGSYASVIGGAAAAAVVFPKEVRARALRDPRIRSLLAERGSAGLDPRSERLFEEVLLEKRAEVAQEFDRIHSVERALAVGSLSEIVEPRRLRPWLVQKVGEWYELKTGGIHRRKETGLRGRP